MIDLNQIRQAFAEHMVENASQRFSFDAALFHVCKGVYEQGFEDGKVFVKAVDNNEKGNE